MGGKSEGERKEARKKRRRGRRKEGKERRRKKKEGGGKIGESRGRGTAGIRGERGGGKWISRGWERKAEVRRVEGTRGWDG